MRLQPKQGRRATARSSLTAAALAVTVCSAVGLAPANAQTVRDSAGIRIVDNRASAPPPTTTWRFSPAPTLQIGAVDGDSTLLLNRTRHATRLSDGRIVVAQPFELRVFSPAGKHLQTIGRRGQGPGEFAFAITGLAVLAGDSLAVAHSQTISTFDPSGRHVRTVSMGRLGVVGSHRVSGGILLPDGTSLLTLHDPEPSSWTPGIIRPRRGFVRVRNGQPVDTAGFFPGLEQVVHTGGTRPDIEARPFARSVQIAAGGDRLFIGDSERYAIRAFSLANLRPVVEIRRDIAPVAVTESMKKAWAELRLGGPRALPAVRRAVEEPMAERAIARADFPRTLPFFASLIGDRTGNLWVREIPPAAQDTTPVTYTVFGRDGHLLGPVRIPAGVEILEIGSDYMIGLWRNEDDVEFVRVYSLVKP